MVQCAPNTCGSGLKSFCMRIDWHSMGNLRRDVVCAETNASHSMFRALVLAVQSTTPEWIFGPKCQQGPITVPDTSATWTCGIQVTGNYACAGGRAITVSRI